MMRVEPTTRLFFGKFAYQISISLATKSKTLVDHTDADSLINSYISEISTKLNGNHKIVRYRSTVGDPRSCTIRLYLDNADDYESFIVANREMISSSRKPLNKECEDLIRNGANLDIRDSLYYSRYRYKLNFKKWWDSKVRKSITSSIKDRLHDPSRKKQDYLISRYGGSVYLAKEEDLVILKMTMSDVISKLTVVTVRAETVR